MFLYVLPNFPFFLSDILETFDYLAGANGFMGDKCLDSCPYNMFGENCTKTCLCKNGAKCNAATGDCDCKFSSLSKEVEGSFIALLVVVANRVSRDEKSRDFVRT